MSLPNDMSRIAGGLAKLEGSSDQYDGDVKEAARGLIRRTYQIPTAAVNANGSNAIVSNAGYSLRMKQDGRVLGAYFVPQAAATANASNYATIAVHKLDGTGNSGVAVASITTKPTANSGSGNLATASTVTLTVTAANARYSRGYLLAADVSQTGSGVALAAGTLNVDVEEEDTDVGNGTGYRV